MRVRSFVTAALLCAVLTVPAYAEEPGPRVPVLLYHAFSEDRVPRERDPYDLHVTVEALDKQIRGMLDSGYTFISFDELYAWRTEGRALPEKPAILTCDDGYENCWRLAFPVFQKYDVKATIFVIGEQVGKEGYFTWEQARRMERSGLVTIATHGQRHVDHAKMSPSKAAREIGAAHAELVEQLGNPDRLKVMAYPYGKCTADTRSAVAKQGFAVQVLTRCGRAYNAGKTPLTEVNRIKCWNGLSGEELVRAAR